MLRKRSPLLRGYVCARGTSPARADLPKNSGKTPEISLSLSLSLSGTIPGDCEAILHCAHRTYRAGLWLPTFREDDFSGKHAESRLRNTNKPGAAGFDLVRDRSVPASSISYYYSLGEFCRDLRSYPPALPPEDSVLILEIRHLNFSKSPSLSSSSFSPFLFHLPLSLSLSLSLSLAWLSPFPSFSFSFHRFFFFFLFLSSFGVSLPFHRIRRQNLLKPLYNQTT